LGALSKRKKDLLQLQLTLTSRLGSVQFQFLLRKSNQIKLNNWQILRKSSHGK